MRRKKKKEGGRRRLCGRARAGPCGKEKKEIKERKKEGGRGWNGHAAGPD